MMWSLGDSNS